MSDTLMAGDAVSREKYAAVNGQWPEIIPELAAAEALSAARRLYRFAFKKKFTGKMKLTSGRRYSYIRNRVFYVNPAGHHFGGWRDLVHDISHYAHARLYPKAKPHDHRHHFLEREMVSYVISSGWLQGKLRRPEAEKSKKLDAQRLRYQRVLSNIVTWERKARRAANALKKLNTRRRRYERVLGD